MFQPHYTEYQIETLEAFVPLPPHRFVAIRGIIFEAFNSKTLEQEQYHHLLFRGIPVINQLPWEKNKTDVDGNSGPIGYAYHEA